MKKPFFTPLKLVAENPEHNHRLHNGYVIRNHKSYNYRPIFGRAYCFIDCPFCGAQVKVYVWSLAGSGKRCSCGAIHTSAYTAVTEKLFNEKAKQFV